MHLTYLQQSTSIKYYLTKIYIQFSLQRKLDLFKCMLFMESTTTNIITTVQSWLIIMGSYVKIYTFLFL